MSADSRRLRATLAAGLLAVLTACGGTTAEQPPVSDLSVEDGDGLRGLALTEPYVVPDLTLTATDGEPYSVTEDTDADVTLVFFGYTHCPDICQVVMADLASAMVRLAPEDRERVEVLFVTTDPGRDDPETLRTYLDRLDPRFEGLTGDLDTIVELGDALAVAIEEGERLPSGGYEVAHSTHVLAVDAEDRAVVLWPAERATAQNVAEDVARILAGEVAS